MGIMQTHGIDRRNFLKGSVVAGGTMALGLMAGCGSQAQGSEGSEKGSGEGSASEFAQAGPKTFADDYIVSPTAAWEKYATVENSGLIEGMNFKDGTLWFIDVAMSNILKVEDGKAVVVYHDDAKKAMPNGAKFIDDTTMLITDRSQGLCTFDIETLEYKVLLGDFKGTPFLGLNDLVLDGQGGAYFTDPGQSDYLDKNGNVYYVRYDVAEPEIELYKTGFAYPNGITISPDANFLYVAEFNTNSILCVPSKTYVDAKDTPYVAARLTGGHGPDGLLTDADGNIYAAHLKAGEVVVVDPDGWDITTVRLPEGAGIFVSNLTIHDGYLYACEFGQGIIWRIPTSAKQNALG